ncbi:hypothetical protein HUT18_20340 [Streptomyces sp. NA04227]|uniref:hypothetical protein n=1 Tax=Streptomyces sp. NA04227 TaxID=2742136 RepID=UPI00159113A1|nr:hypothetical protein [Streptomyces sp. NA04227]QKW08370.1 hypothetical protein HUT18_20340 [Streptomyces sp. NA04227]
MKSNQEINEILAAFDATESVRSAAKIAACDPKTVRRYVTARAEGRPVGSPVRRRRVIDVYLEKIEEWVERSEGHIHAERVHQRLIGLGFTGSERTTRRAVAEVKARWLRGERRILRPWNPEPGLWLQFGWSGGPLVPGPQGEARRTVLFSAWLAWSRFRVVIPCRERSLPVLTECLRSTLTLVGGVPNHLLTRAEGLEASRLPAQLDALGAHFGTEMRTCVPYDAQAGEDRPGARAVQSGVRIAVADWLPVTVGLPRALPSFAALRAACADLGEQANRRSGDGGPGGTPYGRLAAERARLRPLPAGRLPAHAVPSGVSRLSGLSGAGVS